MTAKYWDTIHVHDYPWSKVASTYWKRYPNPNSKHVFSEDFVECELRKDGSLYTKRFISKTNSLPSWGEHFFRTRNVPLTEEAVIDPKAQTLTTYTRNIGDLRFWMGVTETVVFRQDPQNVNKTIVEKQAWIESDMYGFRSAIKKFGIDRFKKNSWRATEGFDWVLKEHERKVSPSPPCPAANRKLPHSSVSNIQLNFPSSKVEDL